MIQKIYNQNYQTINKNIDYFAKQFLLNGVLFFDDLKIDKNQEWQLMCLLGDKIGFLPNSSFLGPVLPYASGHDEDHKNTFERYNKNKLNNEIFIEWHLENLHKEIPQVAALWNMTTFSCLKDSGKTGFINMCKLYSILPDDLKYFLNDLNIKLTFNTDMFGVQKANVQGKEKRAIQNHPYTNKPVLRIPLYDDEYTFLSDFDKEIINSIQSTISSAIEDQSPYVDWIEWKQNDVVIVDLFVMAHAVKGGFYLGERIFSRIWAYESDPSVVV